MTEPHQPGQLSASTVPPWPSVPPKAPNRPTSPCSRKRKETTTRVAASVQAGSLALRVLVGAGVCRVVVTMSSVVAVCLHHHVDRQAPVSTTALENFPGA
jgi:hypothetical protein